MIRLSLVALLLASSSIAFTAQAAIISATEVYRTAALSGQTSEINAYDPITKRIFVAAGPVVDVLDAATGARISQLIMPAGSGTVNSVAVKNGVLAIAVEAPVKTNNGTVVMYNTNSLSTPTRTVTVGALPDMLTFTPDGNRILVANEGEPSSYNQATSIDPEGSISVINVTSGVVQNAGFGSFNASSLRSSSVRIYGPNASAAQDLEPEYITVSKDGSKAFVTLQENNAIAIVDLAGTPTVTSVIPLGFKNHGLAGNGLDASDRDSISGNIRTYNGLFGMYQPDAIASFEVAGKTYLVTANEGDTRDYTGFNEEVRLRAGTTDSSFTPTDRVDSAAGRLIITNTVGINTPAANSAYVPGARSFSIWDENGSLVFDSGDAIEQLIKTQFPALWDDTRSDNKGPEPESVEIGEIDGMRFLFVGLERTNNILVFDITSWNPGNQDISFAGNIFASGMVGPEGIRFISASESWDGRAYLAVSNEVSANTGLFALTAISEPASMALFGLGLAGLLAARRRPRTAMHIALKA
jgi:DNA-binding beta-propeller fold protein YncE